MGKLKRRKAPEMPYWWWLEQDGCWFCKNPNSCSNCSVIKKDRKKYFGEKIKGRKSSNHKKGNVDEEP